MFGNLSDRLVETFRNLRTKGKLTPADIDATLREIRRALLEADVALEVVKNFVNAVRDRALGDEVSKALNPAQQVVQIVNDELVAILGGEARKISFAKNPPTRPSFAKWANWVFWGRRFQKPMAARRSITWPMA